MTPGAHRCGLSQPPRTRGGEKLFSAPLLGNWSGTCQSLGLRLQSSSQEGWAERGGQAQGWARLAAREGRAGPGLLRAVKSLSHPAFPLTDSGLTSFTASFVPGWDRASHPHPQLTTSVLIAKTQQQSKCAFGYIHIYRETCTSLQWIFTQEKKKWSSALATTWVNIKVSF